MSEESKPKRSLFGRKPVAVPVDGPEQEPAERMTPRKPVRAKTVPTAADAVAFLRQRGQEDAARLIERKLLGVTHD